MFLFQFETIIKVLGGGGGGAFEYLYAMGLRPL